MVVTSVINLPKETIKYLNHDVQKQDLLRKDQMSSVIQWATFTCIDVLEKKSTNQDWKVFLRSLNIKDTTHMGS